MSIFDSVKSFFSSEANLEKDFAKVDDFIKNLNLALNGDTEIDGTLSNLKNKVTPIVIQIRDDMEKLSTMDAIGSAYQTRASRLSSDLSKLRLKLY